jgi:hypothetical protein
MGARHPRVCAHVFCGVGVPGDPGLVCGLASCGPARAKPAELCEREVWGLPLGSASGVRVERPPAPILNACRSSSLVTCDLCARV